MSSLMNGFSSEISPIIGQKNLQKDRANENKTTVFGLQNGLTENILGSIKTVEISPLRSGLIITEECDSNLSDNINRDSRNFSNLNSGLNERYYSGNGVIHSQLYFQTNNIPINKDKCLSNRDLNNDPYLSTYNINRITQQCENTHYVSNNRTVEVPRINIPSNSSKSISTTPSNGLNELIGMNGTTNIDLKEPLISNFQTQLRNQSNFHQHFQTQNLRRNITGSNQQMPEIRTNIQENSNFSVNNVSNNNFYSEKSRPTSKIDDIFQYEQYQNLNSNYLSRMNSSIQSNIQTIKSINQPFFSNNNFNSNQINPMMNPQFMNSVPLLVQIQIESIQDMVIDQNIGGLYNNIVNMDYSIVASFNNVDDKNETYKIGPFPSSSMNNSKRFSCIIHEEISLPFSWSQPVLRLKVIEENDFKADIVGSCSITIDLNSLGIPSQAYLIDSQTNQFKGTLRFVVKLVPNQQNPNYRFDQINGPNSILNRRNSQESSILNTFKGFCCAD